MTENKLFVDESALIGLDEYCNSVFTPEVKKKIRKIQSDYNIEFTTDRVQNKRILGDAYKEILMTIKHVDIRYNRTFAQAWNLTNGWNIEARDIFASYVDWHKKEEFSFIDNFMIDRIVDNINSYLRPLHFSPENLNQLLNITNYYDFFNKQYGYVGLNIAITQKSQNIIKFYDEMLKDIPNKAAFFDAIKEYYITNNYGEFHNKLFRTF